MSDHLPNSSPKPWSILLKVGVGGLIIIAVIGIVVGGCRLLLSGIP